MQQQQPSALKAPHRRRRLTLRETIASPEKFLDDPVVSKVLLATSVVGIVVLIVLSDSPLFFSIDSSNYLVADLFKLSLFLKGTSPYSVEPWAASYPPLYYFVWVVPYLFVERVLGASSSNNFWTYVGLQTISACVMACAGFVIYRTVARSRGSRDLAISLASVFAFCSLAGLLTLVGDSVGLLFLSLGCLFLVMRKELAGVLFVSLAVAFKVHPILGALLLIVYLSRVSRSKFLKGLAVSLAALAATALVPIAEIPDAFGSIVVFHASNLQMYTSNVYAGLLDLFSDLAVSPALSASLGSALDYAWLVAGGVAVVVLSYLVLGRGVLRRAHPVDLLSVGLLVWLLLLKQTLPHYFLWALVPLVVLGRVRSSIYLAAGEVLGLVFFSIGYYVAPTSPVQFYEVPNVASSVSFLVGGLAFAVFDLLAIRALLRQIKSESSPVVSVGPSFSWSSRPVSSARNQRWTGWIVRRTVSPLRLIDFRLGSRETREKL